MAAREPTGNASSLTRDAVIDAAGELVAEVGYEGLSMRTLADRCGVATMTLYRHVRTKEDLLGALGDRVLAQLPLPEPGTLSWDDEIRAVCRGMHTLLLEHPEVAEIVARQHLNSESAYHGAERVLTALARVGIEGEQAVAAFSMLVAFTVGFTLQQLQPDARAARLTAIERLDADRFEHVVALGGVFLMRSDGHFDQGLDIIIKGLAATSGGS